MQLVVLNNWSINQGMGLRRNFFSECKGYEALETNMLNGNGQLIQKSFMAWFIPEHGVKY